MQELPNHPDSPDPSQSSDPEAKPTTQPLADPPPPSVSTHQRPTDESKTSEQSNDQALQSTDPSTEALPSQTTASEDAAIPRGDEHDERTREMPHRSKQKGIAKVPVREGRGSKRPSVSPPVASLPAIEPDHIEQSASGAGAEAEEEDEDVDTVQLDEEDAQVLAAAKAFENDMAAWEDPPECGDGGWLTGKTLPDPYPYRHFHSTGMPAASRMLAWKWNQTTAEKNKRKLTQVASSVDCKPPRKYHHLQQNLKRTQMQEERQMQIEKDNRTLYNKMNTIMQSSNRTKTHLPPLPHNHSLNETKRRQQLEQINKENSALLKRINAKEAFYDHKQCYEERKQTLFYLQNIAEYPVRFMLLLKDYDHSYRPPVEVQQALSRKGSRRGSMQPKEDRDKGKGKAPQSRRQSTRPISGQKPLLPSISKAEGLDRKTQPRGKSEDEQTKEVSSQISNQSITKLNETNANVTADPVV
ncbi:hypothetical protein HK097_006402 [Rhizophlyctis rosea]|uniref:Uncharacterized protein n=1 Tax=Rhizophlyctis rosea TaxID=64517 RepID=A0AAD5SS40_9FUNG|nr:hypothetical protein HK097_006402 [Rhizophlyctis rosea]